MDNIESWVKILIYILSICFAGVILFGVKWNNIMRESHTFFGVIIYIFVSIILGYLFGEFILHIIALNYL
jgi:uncharacterized membrane protein YwzB